MAPGEWGWRKADCKKSLEKDNLKVALSGGIVDRIGVGLEPGEDEKQ